MTILYQQQNESIKKIFKQFSNQQTSNTQLMKSCLLSIQIDQQEQINRFNIFIEKEIRNVLTQIMASGNFNKVAELISLLCDLSIQQKYGQNKYRKTYIKQSLAIIIVQDVLECLGINDLKQILPIISQKICSFKQLDLNDQNRMLRIINHLLKRISKTQDYLIRGQLQFTLTKILPICHDSGFNYRVPVAKGIEMAENQQGEEYKNIFSSDRITYQFYKDFWQLQKYFMDPNQLSLEEQKNTSEQIPKKLTQISKTQPIILLKLKHIEKVLIDIVSYMKENPCVQKSVDLLSQPIKFLTNSHLLQYQLNDQYFRKIILVQVLLFTFTLTHLKPNGSILKGIMLTELQRQTISRIDEVALKYLQILVKSKQKQNKGQGQISESSIFQIMKNFFTNELEWIELKDHWKQKKKAFLRTQIFVSQPEQKQKKQKESLDYNYKIAQMHQRLAKQMNIDGQTLLNFLTEPCVPHIVTTPTQTSFSYYWSQTKSCLDNFDYQKVEQIQFQTKTQYNMFQWKALRSLYKENIKEICFPQKKNPVLRQFKALAYVDKKQRDFKEQQQNFNQQNLVTSELKNNNLFVIRQVSQSKQVSKQKNQKQNISQKQKNQIQNISQKQKNQRQNVSQKQIYFNPEQNDNKQESITPSKRMKLND